MRRMTTITVVSVNDFHFLFAEKLINVYHKYVRSFLVVKRCHHNISEPSSLGFSYHLDVNSISESVY